MKPETILLSFNLKTRVVLYKKNYIVVKNGNLFLTTYNLTLQPQEVLYIITALSGFIYATC
jgi:Tfp pilus assembly protein PilZ